MHPLLTSINAPVLLTSGNNKWKPSFCSIQTSLHFITALGCPSLRDRCRERERESERGTAEAEVFLHSCISNQTLASIATASVSVISSPGHRQRRSKTNHSSLPDRLWEG